MSSTRKAPSGFTAGYRAKRAALMALVPVLAILMSFLVCSALLALYNADPVEAYSAMFRGAFGSRYNISETIAIMIPLLLMALGIAVVQTCNNHNIGCEGQLYMGALGAVLAAGWLPANLPAPLAVLSVIVAGAIFGAIWISLAAVMKAYYGVSEIVMTVMMNEIAKGIFNHLISGPLQDPESSIHQTALIPENYFFPALEKTKIHFGLIIAVVLMVLIWLAMNRTSIGLQIRAVGQSRPAAAYAGISEKKVIIGALLFSGALAGLAGAGQVAGVYHRAIEDFSPGYGFMAIAVSLLGKRNPFKIFLASLGFSALITGALAMQRAVGTPSSLASIIQAITVLFWILSGWLIGKIQARFLPDPIKSLDL